MATGQVLFQRFYYSKSFVKHNMEVSIFEGVGVKSLCISMWKILLKSVTGYFVLSCRENKY